MSELGAALRLGLDVDLAAVGVDDPLRDGETEARAGVLRREERVDTSSVKAMKSRWAVPEVARIPGLQKATAAPAGFRPSPSEFGPCTAGVIGAVTGVPCRRLGEPCPVGA